jgi:hypothetical protein
MIVLVPVDSQRPDLFKTATTDVSGHFKIQGVAPGSYLAFAWPWLPNGIWRYPEFYRAVEGRGTRVTISEGASNSIDLTLLPEVNFLRARNAVAADARSVLLAQAPAPATVRGVLVRWGTEEPVGQATLELRSAGSAMPAAISVSQDNGEFVFTNIPAGTYRLVAFAEGFAPAEYGQLRPNGNGSPVTVVAGNSNNFRMRIAPGGILAGRVTNQNGQPMVYSNIEILKTTFDATGQINAVVALSVFTNDLGEYRAFWLAPGQYIVRAGRSQLNSYSYQGTTNPVGTDTTRANLLISRIPGQGRRPIRKLPIRNPPLLLFFLFISVVLQTRKARRLSKFALALKLQESTSAWRLSSSPGAFA